jgi:hypothetical protein
MMYVRPITSIGNLLLNVGRDRITQIECIHHTLECIKLGWKRMYSLKKLIRAKRLDQIIRKKV